MVEIQDAQGSTIVAYEYFADHRRAKKDLASGQGPDQNYVYDADRNLQIYEASNLKQSFVYGKSAMRILAYVNHGATDEIYGITEDALGSSVGLYDSSGMLVEEYEYDAYGKMSIVGSASNQSAYGNVMLYAGYLYEAEVDHYWLKFRVYDPNTGRFLTIDPIGVWGDALNFGNGYGYGGVNPVALIDLFGLQAFGADKYVDKVSARLTFPNSPSKQAKMYEDTQTAKAQGSAAGAATAAGGVAAALTVSVVGPVFGTSLLGKVATGFVAGMVDGATTVATNSILNGEDPVASEVTTGAAIGGVLGGAAPIIGKMYTAAKGFVKKVVKSAKDAGNAGKKVGSSSPPDNTVPNGGSETFEIKDGVRRSKAADLTGKKTIEAEVFEGDKLVGTREIPIESLRSPKDAIDMSNQTNVDRYMRVQKGTQEGAKIPPIKVQRGSNGKPIKDVEFDTTGDG